MSAAEELLPTPRTLYGSFVAYFGAEDLKF